VTSAGVARDRVGDDVIHQYVPLDLKPAVSRFLDHWKPDLAIIAESEIWPMTILELGARRDAPGSRQWPSVRPVFRALEQASEPR
jgi:3-deoxy-D-manno-octulosonic-acid transferase